MTTHVVGWEEVAKGLLPPSGSGWLPASRSPSSPCLLQSEEELLLLCQKMLEEEEEELRCGCCSSASADGGGEQHWLLFFLTRMSPCCWRHSPRLICPGENTMIKKSNRITHLHRFFLFLCSSRPLLHRLPLRVGLSR